MSNDFGKAALKYAPDKDMAEVLRRLAAKNPELVEAANAELNGLRSEFEEKAKAASKLYEPLTPEQQESFLSGLKSRFDALPQLHEGISWTDVEKSLKADTEAMQKLNALDQKGHAMNVFGEDNGELIFVSGWNDYNQVSKYHRNIVFDKAGQDYLAKLHPTNELCNGNAVDIATALGVDLADPNFHQQLINATIIGEYSFAWLKCDAAKLPVGNAFYGNRDGIFRHGAHDHSDYASFRAALRVKRA